MVQSPSPTTQRPTPWAGACSVHRVSPISMAWNQRLSSTGTSSHPSTHFTISFSISHTHFLPLQPLLRACLSMSFTLPPLHIQACYRSETSLTISESLSCSFTHSLVYSRITWVCLIRDRVCNVNDTYTHAIMSRFKLFVCYLFQNPDLFLSLKCIFIFICIFIWKGFFSVDDFPVCH